jgi:hypothetical protein
MAWGSAGHRLPFGLLTENNHEMHRLRCGNTEGTSGAIAEYAVLREVRGAAPASAAGPESGLCPSQHQRPEWIWTVGLNAILNLQDRHAPLGAGGQAFGEAMT